MPRLFRTRIEKKKSIWRRAVDLALTDVGVLVGGMDNETLESLEERLLAADFGVQATLRLIDAVESRARRGQLRGGKELREALEEEVGKILESTRGGGLRLADSGPHGVAGRGCERSGEDHDDRQVGPPAPAGG